MHFTLPHKNKKKTAVRHTFQTFITLSLRFLIFVNKREKLGEDKRTGTEGVGGRDTLGVGGRGAEATVLLGGRIRLDKNKYSQ